MTAGALTTPEAVTSVPPTSREHLDEALATLRQSAPLWADTGIIERRALLETLLSDTLAAGPAWAAAAAAAKGIPSGSVLTGEDWGSGVAAVLRNLRLLERTLADIQRTGRPQPPRMSTADDGQVRVTVLPAGADDRLLFTGFSAEVRLQRGVTADEAEARMGRIYRPDHRPEPGVALVLGAGNVSSIGPMDALHQLFAEGRVALLKMNPVNEHLGPHIGEAFQALITAGLLRIVYGGGDVGRYLTDHPGIDAIHITGSDKTYDAIVFGTGDEGRERKRRGERRISTPVTAELGNVTPVIVVPGPWSERDLAFQGHNLASMLTNNAGFNCIATRVIVQHRAWAKRRALLEAVRASLRVAEDRVAYYPGARERWELFTQAHRSAEFFGTLGDDRVPFTLIPELDPTVEDDIAYRTEAFCGVMSEVALDAPRSVPAFLDAAVDFCNGTLWGTLAASILVHPRSMADPEVAAAVERAIDRLRYGSVVVNHFAGAAYAFVSPPWGPYPGAEPTDIQSGTGTVHNTFLLEDVEKTVVRGPFRPPVRPVWFHTHRRTHTLLPALAAYTATGDRTLLPRLLWEAARG